jgi:crossover junction endodeoxyribonuclease RuvC
MNRVVGLDLSLTATGVADNSGAVRIIKTKLTSHDRLRHINDAVLELVCSYHGDGRRADLVVVEGPSYGSQGSSYHQLAGLWWLLTHSLWRAALPYAVVSPQARAKYATGKGNAGKDAVLAAVVRRYPQVEISDNNAADAWVLMAMGCDYLGEPLAEMPAAHREALAKVAWPTAAPPDGKLADP